MRRLQSSGTHDLSARIGVDSLDDVLRAIGCERECAVVWERDDAPGRDCGTVGAGPQGPADRGAITGRCGGRALDVCLREMSTAVRSFERTHAADVARRIAERDARDRREMAALAASDLARAALKALAKLPAQRYAEAEQIHAKLHGLAHEEGLLVEVARVARCMRDRFPGSRGERRRMS